MKALFTNLLFLTATLAIPVNVSESVVDLRYVRYRGLANPTTGNIQFLGIRYAEAPVGELRFAAPKKFDAPKGTVFEASEWVSNQDVNG